jgi:arylsulfatase A-like enzyme
MVGGHGLFHKGVFPFEECHHIPLLLRWPARIPAGSRCHEFVTLADLAPTFCEVAGAAPLPNISGRSLLPLLQEGAAEDWPQTTFAQFSGMAYYYTQRLVQDTRYKYVFNTFDFDELYDLETDPGELENLAADPAYEPVKRRLVLSMWDWIATTNDTICSTDYPIVAFVPYGPLATTDRASTPSTE